MFIRSLRITSRH